MLVMLFNAKCLQQQLKTLAEYCHVIGNLCKRKEKLNPPLLCKHLLWMLKWLLDQLIDDV